MQTEAMKREDGMLTRARAHVGCVGALARFDTDGRFLHYVFVEARSGEIQPWIVPALPPVSAA